MKKCSSEYDERMFSQFDEDGDGKLSPEELQRCVGGAIGVELVVEEVQLVVDSLDSDGDGLLCFDDFVELMESCETEEEKVKDLRKAFGMYEMDGRDCITLLSLMRMLSRLGEYKTVDQCMVIISRFDLNGDGVLSFEEFKVMMFA